MENAKNRPTGDDQFPRTQEGVCEFLVRNYGLVYTIAYAHVSDTEIAQEVAQDVCVRILLQREKVAQATKPTNWLASIARNTAIDWIRRRQSHSRLMTTMAEWNIDSPNHADLVMHDARTAAIRKEETSRLHESLAQLDPADRELLILHYMDGREKKEVARIVGIHPSTVGRRMNRAVGMLRKALGTSVPTSIALLQTSAHSHGNISHTLALVRSLDASKKAALNSIAAPLPLPPGAPLSNGMIPKIVKGSERLRDGIIQNVQGAALPAILTATLIVGTVIIGNRNMTEKNSATAEIAYIKTDVTRLAPNKNFHTTIPSQSHNRGASTALPMIGLVPSAAGVKGYIPATTPYDLAGFLTNAKGQPIASAEITAWCQTDDGYTSFSTTSDANGRYVFQKLPDGYVNLTALADGYAHATQGEYHTKLPAPASLGLNITLDRPVQMQGSVVNQAGEPIPGAKVIVAREFDENDKSYQGHLTQDIFVTHTDKAGRFHFPRLKPGGIALVIQHPDYAEKLSSIIKTDDKHVQIKLNRGITLIGSLHDGETTLTGVNVQVIGGAMSHRQFGGGVTTTDENGRFEMHHLTVPSETSTYWSYSVIAKADTKSTMPRYSIAVSNNKPTLTLAMNTHDPAVSIDSRGRREVDLQPPDRFDLLGNDDSRPTGTATLEGTIKIPDGLTSGSIVTASLSNGKSIWEQAEVVNGRFRITNMPAGHYSILCYQTKNMRPDYKWLFQPQIVDLRDGDFQTVAVRPGSATVKVRVKNATAKGDYYMSLATGEVPPEGYLHSYSSVATRTIKGTETITIHGVTPGNYYVRMDKGMVQNTKSITCGPGETALVEFEEAPAFKVTGIVIDSSTSGPVEKADITITSAAPNLSNANGAEMKETDSQGRFSVSLTSGTYKLVQRTPGYQQIIFHVTDHDLQLPPIDVKTVESGIAIQFTGLKSGEVIGSFDRELFLVDMNDPGKRLMRVFCSEFSDYLLAQNIKPGLYTLIARFPKHSSRSRFYATVVIPNVNVIPDQYTKIEIPVEPATVVNLQCNAGSHILTWQNPQFWIQDHSGMRIPVPMRDLLRNELGLAAGKYEFGITLDSSEEQSTKFTVSNGEADKDVVLQLRD